MKLAFRDRCIEIYNIYENHLQSSRGQQESAKRSAPQTIDHDMSTKHSWIRGSWYCPRTTKTPPLLEPGNLCAQEH